MNKQKITVAIIGSCVTRDAFPLKSRFEISYYQARTSLYSIYSDRVEIDEQCLSKVKSAFIQRCLQSDFEKNLFENLENSKPDIVIVDFIDERFDLFCKNDLAVSKTWDMFDSGLWRSLFKQGFLDTPKFSSEVLLRTRDLAARFYHDLTGMVGVGNVFIHQAECAQWFLDKDGRLLEFDDAARSRNEDINMLVRLLVSAADDIIPKKNIINIMQGTRADARNRWGLTAFHYEASYYTRFMEVLDAAVSA